MSSKITIPGDAGEVSDGHHTFNELYRHRCALFLTLMASHPERSWFSKTHDDGEQWGSWFIVGMHLPTGMVTYHFPGTMWEIVQKTGAQELSIAPKWDGHTSEDVIKRIMAWVESDSFNN